MMNPNLYQLIPGMSAEEILFVQDHTQDMTENQLRNYAAMYNSKRKNADQILIFCLIGLVVIAGVHRIMLGQIGMGILYIFTFGLCFVGTIVDAINHKSMTQEYNFKMSVEALNQSKMMF